MCVKNKKLLPLYIEGVVAGKYTLKQASESTGYSVNWIWTKKNEYLKIGEECFIHKLKGRPSNNKISMELEEKIVNIYINEFQDVNFSYFHDCLIKDYSIEISYSCLRALLKKYKIESPETHRVKGQKIHRPRPRREAEGDLVQIDGTPYEWFYKFGNKKKYCMQGAIDDATGKLCALYITENECLYGYNEVYRRMIHRFGIPREAYMDRSAIFAVTPRHKDKLTIEEQLKGLHEHRTQFQRIMDDLCCRQILAWSPQAKGRVERMWKTLQGRLPQEFKMHNIKTVKDANIFLEKYVDEWNNGKFVHEAKKEETFWLPTPSEDRLNEILCARFPVKTNAAGVFKFHTYSFTVRGCRYIACKNFELCISERGLQACIDSKYYDVELLDFLTDGCGAQAQVLDNIFYEYLYRNMKEKAS